MIKYERTVLKNGLTVLFHRDSSTPMAAVNLIYRVGSKNEDENKTGFAHLFEHLMFGGTEQAPDFDQPIQLAGGENNAFTNTDYTDYYITLPKTNIETAFWLESDRMGSPNFTAEKLENERKVVIEEYNQRYLNAPYGDTWLLIRDLVYKIHPYRWATIGKSIDHIASAQLDQVKDFFSKHYLPSNAILSVAGDFDSDYIFRLADKWFSEIPSPEFPEESIPQEPSQTEARRLEVERDVPSDAVHIVFHMDKRNSREFNICDVTSDILSDGRSSRLYQRLVKDQRIFASINAYVTGELDPGLFVFTGHLLEGIKAETGEEAFWKEIEDIKTNLISDYELEKVKNKFEASTLFGELNVMNKALNLGFYEMLGDAEIINKEVENYKSVTAEEIRTTARRLFNKNQSNTLIYRSKSNGK